MLRESNVMDPDPWTRPLIPHPDLWPWSVNLVPQIFSVDIKSEPPKASQSGWEFYCPQSFSGGGLYLNVNWLLWSVYDGLLWYGTMVTMVSGSLIENCTILHFFHFINCKYLILQIGHYIMKFQYVKLWGLLWTIWQVDKRVDQIVVQSTKVFRVQQYWVSSIRVSSVP